MLKIYNSICIKSKIDIYSNNKNFRLHDEFIPYNWNYPSNVYRAVL